MNTGSLYFALAVAVMFLAIGFGVLWLADRLVRSRRRSRYLGKDEPVHSTDRRPHPWANVVAEQGEQIDQKLGKPDETRQLLAQAGWRDARSRAGFYAAQCIAPVVAVVLTLVFVVGGQEDTTLAKTFMFVALAAILGLLAPRYYLRRRAKARCRQLRREVPLFINLLVLMFEAGLNLRQALTSLVEDGRATMPALVAELAPVMRQIEAGGDADALLRDTGKILAVDELETVLGILRQVERFGGEIREPLVDALDIMQSRRAMELREMVNVLSGKMTVVLVTCFFPPLLVFIAGPAFMSIAKTLGNLG